jgi:hypothetical protein
MTTETLEITVAGQLPTYPVSPHHNRIHGIPCCAGIGRNTNTCYVKERNAIYDESTFKSRTTSIAEGNAAFARIRRAVHNTALRVDINGLDLTCRTGLFPHCVSERLEITHHIGRETILLIG